MSQTITSSSQAHGEQGRAVLAKMLMRAFSLWKVPSEGQLALLGLAPENRAALTRYRKGGPLANSRNLLERAGHLLAIHKSLRLLFPHDRDLAYAWMTTRNRAFGYRTPVEAISEWGFMGLFMVRAYLDRARGR